MTTPLSPGPTPDLPPEVPDAQAFRRVVGRYVTGVTVVTTVAGGLDHAMTANSFTSVSLDPLLVLVCVERDSRFHEAVVDAGRWGVSILAAPARRHARWFATRGRPLVGQFAQVPHHRGSTGVALLDESVATLECATEAVYESGDHDILVGRVLSLSPVNPRAVPLVYYASGYHVLDEPGR
ncbi:MAG: flavin reductase family protein [Candidatus Nanopelagicales bacterium]